MPHRLTELFIDISERRDWPDHFESVEIIRSRIEYLATNLVNRYDPVTPYWNYRAQISNWLEKVDSIEDKFMLLNTLSYFTFWGRDQNISLCKQAFSGPIIKWLIQVKGHDILAENINELLTQDIRRTCFSAATDSMNIADFHHVNKIVNEVRLTWSSTVNVSFDGNYDAIRKALKNYDQIVVLEDFVGSGNQVKHILDFISELRELEILFVPLTISSQGNNKISSHIQKKQYHNISYEPIAILPWELTLDIDNLNRPEGHDISRTLEKLKTFAETNHSIIVGDASLLTRLCCIFTISLRAVQAPR
jgi:hypothetical protein